MNRREVVTYVVVGIVVFVALWLYGGWVTEISAPEPEPVPREEPRLDAPEAAAGMGSFGYDETGSTGQTGLGTNHAAGTLYQSLEGGPEVSYSWQLADVPPTWPEWPAAYTFASGDEIDQVQHSVYCVYDEETLAVQAVYGYVECSDVEGPEATAAIYEHNAETEADATLVASSAGVALGGEGWYEFPITLTLQEGTLYSLHVRANPGPFGDVTYCPYEHLPLTLSSMTEIAADLYVGVGFNSIVELLWDPRLGVRPASVIELRIDEDLESVGRRGPCTGRWIPDEGDDICVD